MLAENKGKNLHDLRIHKDFLEEAQKVQTIKEKIVHHKNFKVLLFE